jgi:hypothetical protein
MKQVADQQLLAMRGGQVAVLHELPIGPRDEHAVFFRVDLPKGTKVGASYSFEITEQDSRSGQLIGGSRYRVEVVPPTKGERPAR